VRRQACGLVPVRAANCRARFLGDISARAARSSTLIGSSRCWSVHCCAALTSRQIRPGLLYLIGRGSLLAMTCYVIALRGLPTATVSTFAYVNPVVAATLGWLLLGERLTPGAIIGGALVLVSVVLLLASRSRRPA
jgi:drug/metabolite transporter (DMT)-like permease